MTKHHRRRSVKQIQSYADLQLLLVHEQQEREYYQGEYRTYFNLACDRSDRIKLLDDEIKSQRETITAKDKEIARLTGQIARGIRADEQPAEFLRLSA